jgi:hypothetical protein
MIVKWLAGLAALTTWAVISSSAQPVIAARSSLLSYADGKVLLNNQAVKVSATRFPQVKQNDVVRTEAGRAEVLIEPCASLRLNQDSSFRMVLDDLSNPQMELLSGSAVIDIAGIAKGVAITLLVKTATVVMAREGMYRFDLSPALLKVFYGQATVQRANGTGLNMAAGRMLHLDRPTPEKFDRRYGDALDVWSVQRSLVLARARAGEAYQMMAELAAAASRSQSPETGVRMNRRRTDVIYAPPPSGCIPAH